MSIKEGTTYLLIEKYFGLVYDYVGKAYLSEGYWNPKKKIGGNNAHFRNNLATIIIIILKCCKMQDNVWPFFPN